VRLDDAAALEPARKAEKRVLKKASTRLAPAAERVVALVHQAHVA
jgi:hypothetical protein